MPALVSTPYGEDVAVRKVGEDLEPHLRRQLVNGRLASVILRLAVDSVDILDAVERRRG